MDKLCFGNIYLPIQIWFVFEPQKDNIDYEIDLLVLITFFFTFLTVAQSCTKFDS